MATPEKHAYRRLWWARARVMVYLMDNLHLCRGPQIDSICGHYVEWGGQSSDPAVALAHRSQIDVGKHREYCQLE